MRHFELYDPVEFYAQSFNYTWRPWLHIYVDAIGFLMKLSMYWTELIRSIRDKGRRSKGCATSDSISGNTPESMEPAGCMYTVAVLCERGLLSPETYTNPWLLSTSLVCLIVQCTGLMRSAIAIRCIGLRWLNQSLTLYVYVWQRSNRSTLNNATLPYNPTYAISILHHHYHHHYRIRISGVSVELHYWYNGASITCHIYCWSLACSNVTYVTMMKVWLLTRRLL